MFLSWVFVFIFWGGYAHAQPNPTFVTDLGQYERFSPLLLQEDLLWLGTGKGVAALNPIDGKILFGQNLEHLPRQLSPFGNNSILAVGLKEMTVSSPGGALHVLRKGYATSLTAKGGKLASTHLYEFPNGFERKPSYFPYFFAGTPGQMFFSLQADNYLLHFQSPATFKLLAPKVHMAQQMVQVGNRLYLIDRDFVDYLLRIDLSSETKTELLSGVSEKYLFDLYQMKQRDWLVVLDRQTLIVLDLKNDQPIYTISTPNRFPTRVGEYGHCLVIFSSTRHPVESYENLPGLTQHSLHFVDLKTDPPQQGVRWDFDDQEGTFIQPSSMAIHEPSDSIYLTSAGYCPGCTKSPNSLLRFSLDQTEAKEFCQHEFLSVSATK